jgi:perosamine synthetase
MKNKKGGRRVISCSSPSFCGNERTYLLDALDRGWITQGKYVHELESAFEQLLGRAHAIACNSGTAALHLAMLGRGVKPGDAVIVPALTYVATANAVSYCGADVIVADVDPKTWCIDPSSVENKVKRLKLAGRRVTGCIAVHLFNAVADIEELRRVIPDEAWIVEDAAQALGAVLPDETLAGAAGDIGAFSLYGSKTITAGEGGVVVTDNDVTAEIMRLYRGQGAPAAGRYEHKVIGFNYRMSDLAAAVACAQFEELIIKLAKRIAIVAHYHELLGNIAHLEVQQTLEGSQPGAWAVSVKLPPGINAGMAQRQLADVGVETRPLFVPIPHLEAYRGKCSDVSIPIASQIAGRGLTLPTHEELTVEELEHVVCELQYAIAEQRSGS